jgi:hypothetical protein
MFLAFCRQDPGGRERLPGSQGLGSREQGADMMTANFNPNFL